MNDLISRQAALRAFEAYNGSALDKLSLEEFDALKMTIWSVPTAERNGKWIDYCGDLKCDQCGAEADLFGIRGEWNYCPNCGARMEVE